MANRVAGIMVSGPKAVVVVGEVIDDKLRIDLDDTWPVQTGDRGEALKTMYHRVLNFFRENRVDKILINTTALIPLNAPLPRV